MKYEGFVATIFGKDGTSRKGKYTAYTFKLEDAKGEEGPWIGFGFDPPPFQTGDYIEVEAEENEKGFLQYVKGTGKQVKNPPARAAAKSSASRDSTSNPVASDAASTSAGGPADLVDRQTQIVLQHSQEMAISAVGILLANDGLPTSVAKSKAGTALRFEEIVAMIDKLTRKFYDDVVTGQLLKIVAPTLVDTSADGPIPEPATEKPKAVGSQKVQLLSNAESPGVF